MGNATSAIIQPSDLRFHITTGAEGSAALAAAESQDGYLELVAKDRANRIARQSMNYSANRLSPSEMAALTDRINSFLPRIPFVLRTLNPTIVPLMPSADSGFPHTRPSDLICLPGSATALTCETFVHELWHLHQRAHYREWTAFFEKNWNWRIYEGPINPDLEAVRRLNPDTLTDPLWIWNNEWVPMCVFLNPNSPSFDNTATWFYNARTGLHYRAIPDAMAAFFSRSLSPSAYEHPCETSAYMITGPPLDCPAYVALTQRWNKDPY